MREKETEFTRKIQTYSKSTIQKISDIMISLPKFKMIQKVVMESKTEQEVVEKLNSL